VALAAWSLGLVPWFVEAWSLQLLAIDPDPRAIFLPAIAHDLELRRDGQQLARRCILNFYCEFFHLFLSLLLEVFLIPLKFLDRLTYPS